MNEMPEFTDYSMENRTYRYYTGDPLSRFGFGLTYGDCVVKKYSIDKSSLTVTATVCSIEGINAEYNMTKMSFVNKMCHSWIRGKIKVGTRLVKQNVSGWISLCRFKKGLPRVLSAPLAREKRGTAPY